MGHTAGMLIWSLAALGVGQSIGGETGISLSVVLTMVGGVVFGSMLASKVLGYLRQVRREVGTCNRRLAGMILVFRETVNAMSIESHEKKKIHDRIDRLIMREHLEETAGASDDFGAPPTMPS